MTIYKLSNIPLNKLRKYLKLQGFEQSKTSKGRGDHEKWTKKVN